eukprot:GFUD01107548.1.p1 GENE.GFUD01107548.1~~GFUD01107548.1.p1  ORF type:complete len:2241 (+),score=686.17 GFUD01107548.1:98-6820(+)
MDATADSPGEALQLWDQVRKEKAAGGYPWTHLNHNEEEEVWINPLKLPADISRETIRRKDGTIPPEWFHLPEGAETPSVDDLLREDSPETDLEPDLLQVNPQETSTDQNGQRTPSGRKTPSGRRTPICGKHRHRHKSSTGSSPAPSLKSEYQSSSSLRSHHQRNMSQPERIEHVESPEITTTNKDKQDTGGYEPVGKNILLPTQSLDKIPGSRSPSSKLPTLPNDSEEDSDTSQGCFPLRKSRSRSKDKRTKKSSLSRRSISRDSQCSEHAYETPKLLQKSFKNKAPAVDRTSKPGGKNKPRNDMEDGYEPVGRPLSTLISEKEKTFNNFNKDKDVRNIERRPQQNGDQVVLITENETIAKGLEDIVNYNEHLSDDNVLHLQRNLSVKSSKSGSSVKSKDGLSKIEVKELKKKKLEEEKLIKEQKKKEKSQRDAEQKEAKQKEKELKKVKERELKEKQKEDKVKKKEEKEHQESKDNQTKQENQNQLIQANDGNKNKSIIDTVIEKVRKLSKDEKGNSVPSKESQTESKNVKNKEDNFSLKYEGETEKQKNILAKEEEKKKEKLAKQDEDKKKKALAKENEEEQNKEKLAMEEEKQKEKLAKQDEDKKNKALAKENEEEQNKEKLAMEEEKQKEKLAKQDEDKKKKALTKENEEEKRREKEKTKQDEKERKSLVKIEKERQAKELKELKEKKKINNTNLAAPTPVVIYADDEDLRKPSLDSGKLSANSEHQAETQADQLYEPVGPTANEPSVAQTSHTEIAEIVEKETPGVEAENISTTEEMAVQSRSPGEDDTKYVSVVSADDFNSFQQNGYHEDEDIDFTPQNGYLEPEDMDTQEVQGTGKGKKAGAPKVNLMGKIAAAGSAIKNARLPSPGEIKEGYLNSAFHKSLHQPLVVKTKVEKTDVQKARQAMTQEKTPSQLGNVTSISDIPVPIIRKSKGDKMETEEEGSGMTMPRNMEELGQAAFNTLPKSMREQNIITAVKENLDPEELERNQALTKSKTPAELAQIHSLAEFPVPEKIKNLLTFERKENEKKEPKKRRHSDCEPEIAEPFTMYSTLPRSLRETKLITNVKVEPDEERLKSRQALVESKSPVELSAITSFSDIPIPSKIKRIMHRAPAASTPGSKLDVSSKSSSKGLSKMNVNDMYSTLPRAFTMELAVTTKVNKDLEEVERRKILIQEKTPMELGNIGSISEFPIPSALQNIFTKSDAAEKPEKPKRKNIEEKRKRNLTTGTFLSADFLPESWRETKLLVSSNVEEPSDLLKSRQELVESKTPAELGQINGLSDFPVPEKIQTLMRSKKRVLKSTEEKEMSKKVSGSAQSLPAMSAFMTIPSSLKSELLVKSKVEDPEIVARNKEIIKNKSVSELSQIRDISDIPIPAGIENFFKQNPVKNNVERNEKMSDSASERPTSPQSFKESIYETLPRSLRETQLLVKSKVDDDEEKVRERQELTRTKSPAELSQISSISDLPIPAPVENLLKKKSEPECPTPPPRKWKKEDIYESIPSSLRSELVVKTMVEEDVEEVELRKELIRTHTPAQLSEIHSISDFPVPKCLENLVTKTDTLEKKTGEEEAEKVPFSMEKIYGTLPTSLMDTKLLVKTLTEDPEVQAARAEIVKSKSVNELSLITSLSDIPIPEAIENFVKKSYAPAERKKKFKAMKSQSTQSLSQSMYSTLPRSLKQDLIVKSLFEDPEVLAERRVIVASKSVSELSQVTSFSDIPIPANLSRVFHKSMERLSGLRTPKQETDEIRPITPGSRSITESMYATLPKSLKNELLVKSCIEDPEIQQERRALTQSKSVSELSQIKSLSEIPIPENIEKLISRAATNKTETPEQQSLADSRPVSRGSRSVAGFKEDMYASLPRSLKDQLIVRTKVEENDEVLHQRQALVESKSPAELSEIHSLGELPIPSRIEAWLHGSNQDAERSNSAMDESPMTLPRSKKEFQEAMYKTLPTSLTQPCIVRSKVEDPNILIERQQLQQTKSIHELSKIRNLNELPIPGNLIKLPDVTLPKVKNILNYIARPAPRTPKTPNGTKSETYHSYEAAQSETVESTPLTEDKMFHGMSNGNESPTASLSNDNYEVISKPVTPEAPQILATPPQEFKVTPQTEEQMPTPPPPEEEEEDHFSLADQIKGTPERSMRNKKKKNRRSHEVHDDMMSTDGSVVSESITSEEIPPPLPPKRVTPSPKKGMSLETQPSMEEEEIEAIPVKGILTLEAVDGNIQVVRNEVQVPHVPGWNGH